MTILLSRYEQGIDPTIVSVYVDIPVFPILSDDELDVLLDACEADTDEVLTRMLAHANAVLQQYCGHILPTRYGEFWEYIQFDNQDGFTAFILTHG